MGLIWRSSVFDFLVKSRSVAIAGPTANRFFGGNHMIERNLFEKLTCLDSMPPDMVEKLCNNATVRTYKAGEYIFMEGQHADRLYILLEGRIGFDVQQNSSRSIRVKDVTTNCFIGLSSVIESRQRQYRFSAKALSDARLLEWNADELIKLCVTDQSMGYQVYRRIAQSLEERLMIKNAQMASSF